MMLAGSHDADVGRSRNNRYADRGVETVRVTSKVPCWFFEIPSLQLADDSNVLEVCRGCLSLIAFRHWERPEPSQCVKVARSR